MKKNVSIILLSILSAITLVLFVFMVLPLEFNVGKYDKYYSASTLIQRGYQDKGTAVFKITNENATEEQKTEVAKIISKRLGKIYGYYNAGVTYDDEGYLEVTVPQTNAFSKEDAEAVIGNVINQGLVEILPNTSESYSSANVLLSNSNFKRTSFSKYVNGTNTWYVLKVVLTKEGRAIASRNFAASASGNWSAFCAIDGQISCGVIYPESNSRYIQIYANSMSQAEQMMGFIASGSMPLELSQIDFDVTEKSFNPEIIVGIIFLLLVVGMIVYASLKYGILGWAIGLSLAMGIVGVVIFMSLGYFSIFNAWAVVGFVIGLLAYGYLTYISVEQIRARLSELAGKKLQRTSVHNAVAQGFDKSALTCGLVCGAMLILGIILWLIPSAFTVSLGNALVYSAVADALLTLVIGRLIAYLVCPIARHDISLLGIK